MIRSIPQNQLRRLRKEHGLTLEQVSQATGLSFSTLHSAETEEKRQMTIANALRLAKFYGLPLEIIWQPLWDRICHEVAPAPSLRLLR